MSFTVTVTKMNGQTVSSLLRSVQGSDIKNLRPSTEGNTGSAAIFENASTGETWVVSETYAAVQTSQSTDMREVGAEAASNKVTSISGSSTDVQYPSAKLLYDQLVLKAALASPTFTGSPTAPTQAAGTNNTRLANTAFVEARARQTPFGTSASAADTYVVTLSPAMTITTGLRILLKCDNANTGAATLAIDGAGAVAIKRRDGSTDLSAADLPAGKYVPMFYDGSVWVCENVG